MKILQIISRASIVPFMFLMTHIIHLIASESLVYSRNLHISRGIAFREFFFIGCLCNICKAMIDTNFVDQKIWTKISTSSEKEREYLGE